MRIKVILLTEDHPSHFWWNSRGAFFKRCLEIKIKKGGSTSSGVTADGSKSYVMVFVTAVSCRAVVTSASITGLSCSAAGTFPSAGWALALAGRYFTWCPTEPWTGSRPQVGSPSRSFPCCQGSSRHSLVSSHGSFYCGVPTEVGAMCDCESYGKLGTKDFYETYEALGAGCCLSTVPARSRQANGLPARRRSISCPRLCLLPRVCRQGA